ncbi:MAG TPA: PKD domain-containing protein, partial [Thermoplasmata archaeon]|nr:PKD domain-containing protein [Thermoplasmata archaeon]
MAHDLTVTSSNLTTLTGMPVNFTATIAGVASVQTTWWWGDGSTSTVTSNPATHTYANPGIYLVYARATDSSVNLHDNLDSLLRFAVLDSYSNDALGNEAQVQGNIVANSSTTTSAQAVLAPNGWVQVSNWVTNLPTDPQWILGA